MKNNIAIFSGSFDPVTLGHLNIIERAANTFSELIVAIGENPNKKYTFNLQERIAFLKNATIHLKNVRVESFDGLLIDFAYEQNANIIVKGVRNNQDFDYERLLHEVSITQQTGIDTHILVCDNKLSHVSSSAVKELCRYQGLIHEYVPYEVKCNLEKVINKQCIIGITGSIGVGKSYVTEKLVSCLIRSDERVTHVDLDKLAHSLYSSTVPVHVKLQKTILDEFNLNDIVKPYDGLELRKRLGEIVFNDINKLNKLNNLIKQPLLTLIRKTIRGVSGIILLNGSLLVESELLHLCNNNVIVINTRKETQVSNLKNRNLSENQIDRRINSQFTTIDKIIKIEKEINKYNYGNCVEFYNEIGDENTSDLDIRALADQIIYIKYHRSIKYT